MHCAMTMQYLCSSKITELELYVSVQLYLKNTLGEKKQAAELYIQ